MTDWLDVGATFQAAVNVVNSVSYATVGTACDKIEHPDCDVKVELDVKDTFTPTGSFGLLARPFRSWEFGSMLRLPFTTEMKGKAKLTFGPRVNRIAGAVETPLVADTEPSASMTSPFPLIFRSGIRYIFFSGEEEVGDIEADFTYEGWSAASKRVVTLNTESLGKPMEPEIVDWRLNDTFSFRIGEHIAWRFTVTSILSFAPVSSAKLGRPTSRTPP